MSGITGAPIWMAGTAKNMSSMCCAMWARKSSSERASSGLTSADEERDEADVERRCPALVVDAPPFEAAQAASVQDGGKRDA